eukprot:Pompholyxophrys_punicea_v1_NODE_563_length_1684_cov_1.659300.p1 type:complete len:290 gc:universal NODE_563_length_1684_cov_1.659300:1198-329(-)
MHRIRLWTQEGNDVLTAQSIFTALDSKKVAGSFPSLVTYTKTREDFKRGKTWPDVRRLSHYQFNSDGSITTWESSNIGPGVRHSKEWIDERCETGSSIIGVQYQSHPATSKERIEEGSMHKKERNDELAAKKKKITSQHEYIDNLAKTTEKQKKAQTGLYYCERYGCSRRFSQMKAWSSHYLACNKDVHAFNLDDFVKTEGTRLVYDAGIKFQQNSYTAFIGPVQEETGIKCEEGWAAKPKTEQRTPLSTDMRSFLVGLFNRGVAADGTSNRAGKVSVSQAENLIKTAI